MATARKELEIALRKIRVGQVTFDKLMSRRQYEKFKENMACGQVDMRGGHHPVCIPEVVQKAGD